MIPRVELGFLFEQPLEREAPLLEKLHVRFAVLYELFLEVKLYIFLHLFSIPFLEFCTSRHGHGFWHVKLFSWDGPHILLVGRCVE